MNDVSFRARSSMDRVLPSEGRGCGFDPRIEDYTMMQSIYSHVEGGFESLFGSFQYHPLDGTQLARRGTEIALGAIRNPDMHVFEEKLVWKHSPEEFAVKKAFL